MRIEEREGEREERERGRERGERGGERESTKFFSHLMFNGQHEVT